MQVFISYCHDIEISNKVLGLADKLNQKGIDCNIDQYELNLSEGWQKWMDKEIRNADYVLIVCTNKYLQRSQGNDFTGKGVQFETNLTFNELYQNHSLNEKYLPIIFNSKDSEFIPKPFEPYIHYNLQNEDGFEMLYRRLTNQPKIEKPNLGTIEKLPTGQNLSSIEKNEEMSVASNENEDDDILTDVSKLEIELKIDREFESYSTDEQKKLLIAIKNLLEINRDLKIKQMRKGSVILSFELSPSECEKLHWAIVSGKLAEFDVIDSQILESSLFFKEKDASEQKFYDAKVPFEKLINEEIEEVDDDLELLIKGVTEIDPLIISKRKAKLLKAWDSIVSAYKEDTIIKGRIVNKTKGGLIVDCFGLETFLPASQIDVKPIIDYDAYVGKTMEFKVVKINEAIKNVVVSHKALIESDLEEQRQTIISKLEKGQVLEGTIKNITDFGAFIDLGGVDGLLYITDISWGRINHPNEVLELNQTLNVVVLDFDDNKKRISLGLKQLTKHPWDDLPKGLKEGSKVKGKVVDIKVYGAVIEITPGVEGLVHISDLSWTKRYSHPNEFTSIGNDLDIVVLEIDMENKKIVLGHKQLEEDPWDTFEIVFPVGSIHEATVVKREDKGAIVQLPYGIEAFAPTRHIKKEDGILADVEETLEFKVLEFSRDDKRIIVSHTRVIEDVKLDDKRSDEKAKKSTNKRINRAIKDINSRIEKTNLGELDVLSNLNKKINHKEDDGYLLK